MSTSLEQVPNHPPELPGRRRTPGVVLAYSAVILLVVIGGSLFWLVQSRGGLSSGQNRKASAATTQPTWVPTPVTPPPLAMFYDTFVNNSHGWSLISNSGYARLLVNNTLILADTNPGSTLVESVPTITNLDNYVVSADFTINQGDQNDDAGLYLRGDSTLNHDYRIDVNGNNTLDIAKEYLDAKQSAQTAMLVPPLRSPYLNPPGHTNTLTAILIGPAITVEINNIVVMTVNDSSYTNGQIALFARHGLTSGGITVSFTRVEIDRLASPFMTPIPTPTLTPSAGRP